LKKSEINSDEFVSGLLNDLNGQITEAFSRSDWFDKWGKHYLRSLMNAHNLQQCNNFKDPGVQYYGGILFRKLRDKADDIFCKLPAPKPTIQKMQSPSHTPTTGHHAAPITDMSVYHNAENPCFHGNSLVLMANYTKKCVKDIRKNNLVMSTNGNTAKVLCVLKTKCYKNRAHLVELESGLLITPWHPIRINNLWQFPCSVGPTTERYCTAVYSFILEKNHMMIINDIECVTLGHHFEEEVVKHPYFGSDTIINDLKTFKGWNLGFIELTKDNIVRDQNNGLFCGLKTYGVSNLVKQPKQYK